MRYDDNVRLKTAALGKVLAAVAMGALATTANATNGLFSTKLVNCDTPWGLTINKAIDIAREGDRIIVTGTCTENVDVDKGVTLDGLGTANIIPEDASLPTIRVAARNAVVTGLILEAPTTSFQILVTDQSLVTISHSQIGNGQVGVHATGASLVTVIGNRIHGNSAEGVTVVENATARVGFQSSLAGPDPIPNVIENNFNGVVVARAHANVAGNQIINNQRNGVVVARTGTARVAGNEIAGNNVGIANVTNGATDLALSNNASILGQPNFGLNNVLSIFCNSGFIGDVVGPDFVLPGIQILGTCENATTP